MPMSCELNQAVKDEFFVDYRTIETELKFMESGINYDELTEAEKEQYEETFDEEEGTYITSTALNNWLFNAPTIDMVLHQLMEKGLKVEGGDKLGKTIIFAQNKQHADKIVERFKRSVSTLHEPGESDLSKR